MIEVLLNNPESNLYGMFGMVTVGGWESGSFWVPVKIGALNYLIARYTLKAGIIV